MVICNNKIFIKRACVRQYLEGLYLKIELLATYTQEQNRFTKRLKNIIKKKTNTIKKEANFPAALWVKINYTAVYFYN